MGIFLVLTGLLGLLGVKTIIEILLKSVVYGRTKGTVLGAVEEAEFRGEALYQSPVVEYYVNGTQYKARSQVKSNMVQESGKKVTVRYKRSDPEQFYLPSEMVLQFAGGIVFIVIFAISYYYFLPSVMGQPNLWNDLLANLR